MTIKTIMIEDIQRAKYNPRKVLKPGDPAFEKLKKAVDTFGLVEPLVWNERTGNLVGGHQRLSILELRGDKHVEVSVVDLDERAEKTLNLALNKQGGEWDFATLADLLQDLDTGDVDMELTGFSADELEKLMTWTAPNAGKTDEDAVPEAPKVPVSKLGDLWLLGKHRLLCGDATVVTDLRRLMESEAADLVFTDPPYGVNYTGGAKKRENLANDHVGTDIYAEALPLLKMVAADHAALYLWYADAHVAAAAAAAAGYVITAQIIWVKNNAQFVSSAHYHGKHEPCFYAHRKGKSAKWYGGNNEVTVWEVDRANKNEYHPTQKPVALVERAMANSSKPGDIVLDLFAGSGSTVIGCEKLGRAARTIEIEPAYVDVAVKRWEDFTGKKATLA